MRRDFPPRIAAARVSVPIPKAASWCDTPARELRIEGHQQPCARRARQRDQQARHCRIARDGSRAGAGHRRRPTSADAKCSHLRRSTPPGARTMSSASAPVFRCSCGMVGHRPQYPFYHDRRVWTWMEWYVPASGKRRHGDGSSCVFPNIHPRGCKRCRRGLQPCKQSEHWH